MVNKTFNIGNTSQSQVITNEDSIIYSDISMKNGQKTNKKSEFYGDPLGRYIDRSINVRAVQNSLDNIFSWIPGERIINPEFGSRLQYYLYEGITQYNEEQVVAEIKASTSKWEPRVVIKNVYNRTESTDRDDNTIVLDIEYYIVGLPETLYTKQYILNRSN